MAMESATPSAFCHAGTALFAAVRRELNVINVINSVADIPEWKESAGNCRYENGQQASLGSVTAENEARLARNHPVLR